MSKGYDGKESNVLIGATDVDAMGWEATFEIETWDSTTTADGGWEDLSPGVSKASGTFSILYNKDKPIFPPTDATPTAGLGIRQGTVIDLLKLYINKTDGVMCSGSALVTKVEKAGDVKGGQIYKVSFNNKGAWTLPGDS